MLFLKKGIRSGFAEEYIYSQYIFYTQFTVY